MDTSPPDPDFDPRRGRLIAVVLVLLVFGCPGLVVLGVVTQQDRLKRLLQPPITRELTFGVAAPDGGAATAELVAEVAAVLEARLAALGVAHRVAPTGEGDVVVGLPALDEEDVAAIRAMLVRPGGASVRVVVDVDPDGIDEDRFSIATLERRAWDPTSGSPVVESSETLVLDRTGGIDSLGIVRARIEEDEGGRPQIAIAFDDGTSAAFAALTTARVRERVAIILDDRVLMAPVVVAPITGGEAVISLGHGWGADPGAERAYLRDVTGVAALLAAPPLHATLTFEHVAVIGR